MAKISKIPALQIIRGLKGTIDFYVYRGQPCARRWPRSPGKNRSPASLATAAVFRYLALLLPTVDQSIRATASDVASGTSLTWKDILTRAYYGHLIDKMAIEVQGPGEVDLATQATLASILARLDVALSTRALESGGNLASILAALDVALSTRALESGGVLDDILAQMPGLMWGYTDRIAEPLYMDLSPGGTQTLNSTPVPAGEIHIIQALQARDSNSPTNRINFGTLSPGQHTILYEKLSPLAGEQLCWDGGITLKEGDFLRAYFYGTTQNDELIFNVYGYKMSLA